MNQTTSTISDVQGSHDVDCIAPVILSTKVTMFYGAVYVLLLIIVSLYSFNYLMRFNSKFKDANCKSFQRLKMWMLDIWKRRRCYVPIAAHLFDQITDIAVAIQFYQLAQSDADCNDLNIWSLFILTVLSMVVYRAISSFLIYKNTQSLRRAILQILDLELFEALYINYICNKTEPSDPQRWITLLEAALESSPQTVIQLVFLIKTGSPNSSFLITISLLSSFWSIISKVMSDDKMVVVENAQSFVRTSKSFYEPCPCNSLYVFRVIWRVFDVSNHILVMSLLWIAVGGFYVAIKVGFELVIFVFICYKTNQWEFLFGLVALVVSVATPQLHKMSWYFLLYRTMTMVAGCIVVSMYLDVVPGWVLYIWLALLFSTSASVLWLWPGLVDSNLFEKGKSSSRDLKDMIKANNEHGILEMQLFCNQLGVYDEEKRMTLLMLAMKAQIAPAVLYILNNVDADYLRRCDAYHCNVLDYLCWLYTGDPSILVTRILYKIYQIDPALVCAQNRKTGNSLLLYIQSGGDLLKKLNIKWTEAQIKWFSHALLSLNASLIDKTIIKNTLNILINELNITQFENVLDILEIEYTQYNASSANAVFKVVECERQSGLLHCFGHRLPDPYTGLQTFEYNCIQIAAAAHSLFLDDTGRVYAFGYQSYLLTLKESMQSGQSNNWNTPSLLTFKTPYRAKQVGVGNNHSLVLMDNGNIWSFGRNDRGQLGHNDDVQTRPKPKMIESIKDECISYIACSSDYNCIIERTGKLFTFGSRFTGLARDKIKVPTEIALDLNGDEILTVSCGSERTLILTAHGKVWPLLPQGKSGLFLGEMIDSLGKHHIVDISCGKNHSLCVDQSGALYSWGQGTFGQLGYYQPNDEELAQKDDSEPKIVEFFQNENIKIVKCCGGFEYSSVIADNGDMYMFGRGDGGQLGNEEKQEKNPVPIKVECFNDISVSSVSLGYSHSAVIEGKPRVAMVDNEEKKEEENQLQGNKSYHVWVKKNELFGDEWVLMDRS
eukprot:774642_1